MKKIILFISVYLLYFCSIPVFFFSNQKEISSGKFIKFIERFVPREWVTDKAFHFSFFFISSIVLYFAHILLIKYTKKTTLLSIFTILGSSIIIVEFLQPFFNRSFEFADIVYGMLGLSLAINMITFLTKFKQ